MKRLSFYYPFAALLGVATTSLVLEIIGLTWQAVLSPLWLGSMLISNITVAYLFREGIRRRKGLSAILLSLWITAVNMMIFSFLAMLGIGGVYGMWYGITKFHFIAPFGILAMYLMRWADSKEQSWRSARA